MYTPYKRGTQLHAPRSFMLPQDLGQTLNFDDNPGEKVMIV
jgi:hypothetical protein